LFISPRSVCPSFSLALNVVKKQCAWIFLETKVAPSWVAAAAAFRKNFQLNLRKAKLTFTVCLLTKFMVLQEGLL